MEFQIIFGIGYNMYVCVCYHNIILFNESRYEKKPSILFFTQYSVLPTIPKRMLVIPVYKHLILYTVDTDIPHIRT